MGSLPSPPRPANPPPSPVNALSNFRVFATFCSRDLAANMNASNWIECYEPANNSWTRVSPIPYIPQNHALKDFAMVSIGGSVYIIGGRLLHKQRCQDPHANAEVVLSSVLRYDVQSQQWARCGPMGFPRYDFACTVYENKIYVAGGKSSAGCARGISSAEVYNPRLDVWTPLANMSTLRYKCVGLTWQGKIHVVSGFAEREDSDRTVPFMAERSSAEVFDVEAERWEMISGMWKLDVPPNQIVAVDGRLFSSGDCLKAWKGHIESYDGNIWNEVDGSHLQNFTSPMNSNGPLIYLTVAPIGTHLYFLAGYRIDEELSRTMSIVHVFDTSANTDAWKSFEPTEVEGDKVLCSHCCVVQLS
ncbi:hypothetical protein FNV43_RR07630 [Rhamnella rubrinervis]|uniref:Uncharacterized protein n=1 Tax=Rhamnella rubrinervis TaxID=2594499 RepID=A0A8K0MN63_9ROSA|nr:hypothetical protein FNV43_RR07630 [Rhamnella rubrinervis]